MMLFSTSAAAKAFITAGLAILGVVCWDAFRRK